MRVVIVTGGEPHHQNLCVKLAQSHEVVGILHPAEAPGGIARAISRLGRQIRKEGAGLALLHGLKGLPAGRGPGSEAKAPGLPDFAPAVEAYRRLDRALIHEGCDVKAPETAALLRSLKPDVTVCLGGPVYPKAFVEASPLMLNFHSGVSPIYNGTASIQFAFANGHPHLCGGTLMVMGATVDGGGILGHYLPAVGAGDTAATLFQKTVNGAAGMYDRVLKSLTETPRLLTSVRQPRALFYTRGVEYGWHHRVMALRHGRADLPSRHARAEKIAEYWREPDAAGAGAACRETIETLLWGEATGSAR